MQYSQTFYKKQEESRVCDWKSSTHYHCKQFALWEIIHSWFPAGPNLPDEWGLFPSTFNLGYWMLGSKMSQRPRTWIKTLGVSGIMHITWVRVKIYRTRTSIQNDELKLARFQLFLIRLNWKWCINMDLFRWRSKILFFFFSWKNPETMKKFPLSYESLLLY